MKASPMLLGIFFFTALSFIGTIFTDSDPTFDCLTQDGPIEVVSGNHGRKRFEPKTAPYKKFDARNATFEIPDTISHQMISLRDDGNDDHSMCWAGGYITASSDWHGLDISWEQSKQGYDNDENDRGEMENTSSATSYEDNTTWTGMHVYNVHDGIRTNNSKDNWTVQHSWFEYVRDDCLENDHIYSGLIFDVLFDGCYAGISVRPSSSGLGQDKTIKLDKVLLRMEPMPYPYKWDETDNPKLYPAGYGDTPFGYGNAFKLHNGNEPTFEITNSVFLHEYDAGRTIFPPKESVSVCHNNTIIWLAGPDSAPYYLDEDFPDCFTIITDADQGRQVWMDYVNDWHRRHPAVGSTKKIPNPGAYTWPRYPAQAVLKESDVVENGTVLNRVISYLGAALLAS